MKGKIGRICGEKARNDRVFSGCGKRFIPTSKHQTLCAKCFDESKKTTAKKIRETDFNQSYLLLDKILYKGEKRR